MDFVSIRPVGNSIKIQFKYIARPFAPTRAKDKSSSCNSTFTFAHPCVLVKAPASPPSGVVCLFVALLGPASMQAV